jgi:hypothetical protein
VGETNGASVGVGLFDEKTAVNEALSGDMSGMVGHSPCEEIFFYRATQNGEDVARVEAWRV